MSTPTPVMWRLGRSLLEEESMGDVAAVALAARERDVGMAPGQPFLLRPDGAADTDVLRSEERRVGKEGRSWWSREDAKINKVERTHVHGAQSVNSGDHA